jgi:Xaa-Pro aminopeptidase
MRKTPEQLAIMRRAGKVVAEMHEKIRAAVRPGA